MPNTYDVESILEEIRLELGRATEGNPPFNTLHEGYAVILKEMDELKTEVWKNPRKHWDRDVAARREAIQVATMAIRLVHDLL